MPRRFLPYALLAPSVLFLLVFFAWPLVQTAALAFRVNGAWSTGNFTRMAGDLNFVSALRNTFALVIVVIPLQIGMALVMALMLQKLKRGRDLVLWIWAIPLGISDLAAGLVWLAILCSRPRGSSTARRAGSPTRRPSPCSSASSPRRCGARPRSCS